jgi:CRP-like cAMP-binding protein
MNLFSSSSTSQNLEGFLSGKEHQTFHRGELIWETGNDSQTLCYTSSGFVKRYSINSSGAKNAHVIYEGADIFPIRRLIGSVTNFCLYQEVETHYYEPLSDAQITFFNLKELQHLLQEKPALYQELLWMVSKRLNYNIHFLDNIALSDARKRLAHMLTFYAQQFGMRETSGVKIMAPITQQDLSEFLFLARETITRQMSELRDQGLVITNDYIIIPDLERLEQEAFS